MFFPPVPRTWQSPVWICAGSVLCEHVKMFYQDFFFFFLNIVLSCFMTHILAFPFVFFHFSFISPISLFCSCCVCYLLPLLPRSCAGCKDAVELKWESRKLQRRQGEQAICVCFHVGGVWHRSVVWLNVALICLTWLHQCVSAENVMIPHFNGKPLCCRVTWLLLTLAERNISDSTYCSSSVLLT